MTLSYVEWSGKTLLDQVTFELSHEGSKGLAWWLSGERAFQAGRTAGAKLQRQGGHSWCVGGTQAARAAEEEHARRRGWRERGQGFRRHGLGAAGGPEQRNGVISLGLLCREQAVREMRTKAGRPIRRVLEESRQEMAVAGWRWW